MLCESIYTETFSVQYSISLRKKNILRKQFPIGTAEKHSSYTLVDKKGPYAKPDKLRGSLFGGLTNSDLK